MSLHTQVNASPITKITSWLKFLGKNLHLRKKWGHAIIQSRGAEQKSVLKKHSWMHGHFLQHSYTKLLLVGRVLWIKSWSKPVLCSLVPIILRMRVGSRKKYIQISCFIGNFQFSFLKMMGTAHFRVKIQNVTTIK